MKKKSILLASVLKPVNEPRMYEKMGLSLLKGNDFDIHIAGSTSHKKDSQTQMSFHEIHSGVNSISSRIYAWYALFRLCRKVRPDILIVAAPELLLPGLGYKWVYGCIIVYDIQENYFLNIIHHNFQVRFLKILLAKFVRGIESFSARYIDHFILAEQCYQNELPFIQKRSYSIFENTFSYHKPLPDIQEKPKHFIFSGTIHEVTGVHQAINFIEQLREYKPLVTLKISGKAPKKLTQSLQNLSEKFTWLKTNISEKNIPYDDIIYDISEAEYVIASYPITDQNRNKIPSKFYEALALNKKVIAQKNPFWEKEFNLENFLFIDFDNFDIESVSNLIASIKKQGAPDINSQWKNQEDQFIQTIINLDKS